VALHGERHAVGWNDGRHRPEEHREALRQGHLLGAILTAVADFSNWNFHSCDYSQD